MSVILSVAGADDKAIFAIKHAKLYVFVVTLLAKNNQKLSKANIKQKVILKIQKMNIGIFSNQTLIVKESRI